MRAVNCPTVAFSFWQRTWALPRGQNVPVLTFVITKESDLPPVHVSSTRMRRDRGCAVHTVKTSYATNLSERSFVSTIKRFCEYKLALNIARDEAQASTSAQDTPFLPTPPPLRLCLTPFGSCRHDTSPYDHQTSGLLTIVTFSCSLCAEILSSGA